MISLVVRSAKNIRGMESNEIVEEGFTEQHFIPGSWRRALWSIITCAKI